VYQTSNVQEWLDLGNRPKTAEDAELMLEAFSKIDWVGRQERIYGRGCVLTVDDESALEDLLFAIYSAHREHLETELESLGPTWVWDGEVLDLHGNARVHAGLSLH
jgi:hypothetical protein